jgi:phosphatidylserine/phosphatidylglycerophosphate/cardiolipin synthase-like enzyme
VSIAILIAIVGLAWYQGKIPGLPKPETVLPAIKGLATYVPDVEAVRTLIPEIPVGTASEPSPQPPFESTPAVVDPPAPIPAGTWWEVYFTDPSTMNDPARWQNAMEGRLIEKINAAQNSMHIAAFEFDLTPVAEALIAARQRGVDVKWVTDDEHGIEADAEPGRGQFALLQQAGIEVRADSRSALMHNKFWIFDGQTVWTGSTNVTENGIFKQNNNTIVIHSAEVAAMYEREFQEMWEGQFGPRSPSQLAEQSALVDGTPIQVIFTSEDPAIEMAILPLVNSAQSNIRFLAFSFTDFPLANAMIERARSGVAVAGVFEKVWSGDDSAELKTLFCAQVPVRQDGNSSFMHNKVIVIDGRFVITGSMNFSTNAEENNDENVIILENPEIAGHYMQEFDRIWAQAVDPEPGSVNCQ